jgi:tetratricopeptide (TPR) repeat protein
MEPTAQGVLSKTPLAHLIVYCLDKKLRGSLVLRPEGNDDNAAADVLTLVEGWPAKVRIVDPVEHLGRVLLELGAIDDAAYNESLMALAQGGLQGQALLERGRIDATTLERALRTQIARKVGHLFGRPASTRYAYYEGADFLKRYGGPELYPVDPTPAVFASIRANPSMAHADHAVERVAQLALRVKVHADLSRLELTRSETELVALLRQHPMTPAQIESMGILDARGSKLLTYGLLLMKMIEPVGSSTLAPPAAVTMAPAAARSVAPPGAVTLAPAAARMQSSVPPRVTEQARRAEILAKARAIGIENHFEVLGLSSAASLDEARLAYFSLVKGWHPDRLPAELADLRDEVARIFGRMVEAYQTLSDPQRRAAYLEHAGTALGSPQDRVQVAQAVEANNALQKGELLLASGQFAEAEPYVLRAIEMAKDDPDNVALWCWLQANKPDRREAIRFDDLLARLERALNDNPKSERARFYRGMVLKLAGRVGEAIRDFREVAERNPRHTEAVREVRLYTMRHERDRRNKDEATGSLLGKFAKKK